MNSPSINLNLRIERLQETILARMPDFNGEIETKIREATKEAVENFDFDATIERYVNRYLDDAIRDATKKVIDNTDFVSLLELDKFIKSRVVRKQ